MRLSHFLSFLISQYLERNYQRLKRIYLHNVINLKIIAFLLGYNEIKLYLYTVERYKQGN